MAKKKPKSKSKPPEPPSFEQSLDRLKQIVAELENGNLSLSQSLEQYQQGVASLKQCYDSLNAAQRTIEMLVDLDDEGNLVTRAFDDTASTEATQGSRQKSQTFSPSDDEEDDDGDEEDNLDMEAEDEDMDDPNSLF